MSEAPAAVGTVALIREPGDPVAILEIRNARRRNAISSAMWSGMVRIAQEVAADPKDLRVLMVRGEGTVAFSAGADISEFDKIRHDNKASRDYDTLVEEACRALETLPVPTIAVLRGPCMGGALSVAGSCDFRICETTAVFALPAVRLGLGYDVAGIHRVLRLVGFAAAKEILLSGNTIDAARAKEVGLVHRVSEPADLDATARAFAEGLARNAPLPIAAMKKTLDRLTEIDVASYDDCQKLLTACNDSADYQEGRDAFREKRQPRFRGV